jgi:hypothetical protein
MLIGEISRKQKLLQAQQKARHLLSLIEGNKYIRVGASEEEITKQIFELAKKEFGVTKHWHKRIVRGPIRWIFRRYFALVFVWWLGDSSISGNLCCHHSV